MSAIKLIPASGGGSVSLAPPNSTSGADVTFTLPSTSQSFGKIVQVVQKHRTNVWSESLAAGDKSSAALTKAITTTSSSNQVLITISLTIGFSAAVNRVSVTIKRDDTPIALSNDTSDNKRRSSICGIYNGSNNFEPITFSFLDTPGSAASHSYTVHLHHGTTSTVTAYLNRAGTESNHTYRMRGTSSMILQEVSA